MQLLFQISGRIVCPSEKDDKTKIKGETMPHKIGGTASLLVKIRSQKKRTTLCRGILAGVYQAMVAGYTILNTAGIQGLVVHKKGIKSESQTCLR